MRTSGARTPTALKPWNPCSRRACLSVAKFSAVLRQNMIAFEISRNGQVLAVVGTRDLIGLNAVLTAWGDLNGYDGDVPFFNMAALGCARGSRENTTMHHTWSLAPAEGQFNVGDTLSIRIVRTESSTPPTTSEELEKEDAELDAAPNGGPAAPVDNPSVNERPPSVS